jgi:hypothetical protein
MSHTKPTGSLLQPDEHILAAQDLLLTATMDPDAGRRAQTEALLGAATAVLQLTEVLTSLGALIAAHPVLAHALATRQLVGDLEDRVAEAESACNKAAATRAQ